MARKFAELGARVVLWDINTQALQDVYDELKRKNYDVTTYVCDVSDRSTIYAVADKVKRDVKKVGIHYATAFPFSFYYYIYKREEKNLIKKDILINNAGIVVGKSFLQTTDEQSEKVMNVNIMANMWTVKAFLPGTLPPPSPSPSLYLPNMIYEDMLKSSGHLVSIASAAGHTGAPNVSHALSSLFYLPSLSFPSPLPLILSIQLVDYCASKYAAIGFMDSLRQELLRIIFSLALVLSLSLLLSIVDCIRSARNQY
jgi:all-trans-retinol dehydrogenase (NAD+)